MCETLEEKTKIDEERGNIELKPRSSHYNLIMIISSITTINIFQYRIYYFTIILL